MDYCLDLHPPPSIGRSDINLNIIVGFQLGLVTVPPGVSLDPSRSWRAKITRSEPNDKNNYHCFCILPAFSIFVVGSSVVSVHRRPRHALFRTKRKMRGQIGGNLVLASILSLFSYVPFELVAKGSLLLCVLVFVVDPFPLSRLLSIVSTVVIAALSRALRNHNIKRLLEEDQEPIVQPTDENKKDN